MSEEKGAVDWVTLLKDLEIGLTELLRILSLFNAKEQKTFLAQAGCDPDTCDMCVEMLNAGNQALSVARSCFNCCHNICSD